MATKGKRPMRALTPGDKIEAIQRVNDGESKASVARDIGVPESTLRGWCKNEDKLRYMTSRLSSPDTDRSDDGEPPDKRARPASPALAPAPPSPAAGLDLSASAPPAAPPAPPPPPPPPLDAPVELSTRRATPPLPPAARERRDPGVSASMSAISPLSGLAHLPGLAHSHLGLSFNEIATNLTLLAQLNPGLAGLGAQPASRALRSVRSPKPAHSGLALGEPKPRKHHADTPRPAPRPRAAAPAAAPVDDALWYWLKTQQAMLDLSAQAPSALPLPLKPTEPAPRPVAPAPPLAPHLDYNRNSWLWQYYKQFGGAVPLPDDKLRPAAQGPRDRTPAPENILYSHLTKSKGEDERAATSPTRPAPEPAAPAAPAACAPAHDLSTHREPASAPAQDPGHREPAERADAGRAHAKARTVLDSLLFHSGAEPGAEGAEGAGGAWAEGAAEALAHGDKFLAWLEASGDPAVTRMHVHQLRALLHNLRARRTPAAPK